MINAVGRDGCSELSEKYKGKHKFTNNGFVYVISYSDGMVKVGKTRDFKTRVASLSNGRFITECYCVLTGDYSKSERETHRNLGEFKVHGEYFSCDFSFAVSKLNENITKPQDISDSDISKKQKEKDASMMSIIDRVEISCDNSKSTECNLSVHKSYLFLLKEFVIVTSKIKDLIEDKLDFETGLTASEILEKEIDFKHTKIQWELCEKVHLEYLLERQAYTKNKLTELESKNPWINQQLVSEGIV